VREGWGRPAILLAAATVAGCQAATSIQGSDRSRSLTEIEMDRIFAGSSAAASDANATALGPAPETTTVTSTLASSGITVSAPPFLDLLTLNYAFSQAVASAGNAVTAEATGTTEISVDGGGGGASINATSAGTAAGRTSSQAQINMQFYGLSIGRVDLTFGTAIATACCAPILAAQATADGAGGGYWRELQASPVSDQVQSRVDISVVSSTLPILDAGQVSALVGPTWSQAGNQ
jgi:hypothetical protein